MTTDNSNGTTNKSQVHSQEDLHDIRLIVILRPMNLAQI
jgi:hypothetical protein